MGSWDRGVNKGIRIVEATIADIVVEEALVVRIPARCIVDEGLCGCCLAERDIKELTTRTGNIANQVLRYTSLIIPCLL